MWSPLPAPALILLGLCAACRTAIDDSAAPLGAGHPSGPTDITCHDPDLADLAPPQPWTVVSEDWLTYLTWLEASPNRADEAGEPSTGVQDLAVFDGQLFVGLGDWGFNTGSLYCVESGSHCPYEDAEGHGMPVFSYSPGSDSPELAFIAHEEEIGNLRRTGAALFLPSQDPTEGDAAPDCAEPDAEPSCPEEWDREHPRFELGNFTRLQAGIWSSRPLLEGALHVFDIAAHNGSLFAVGSGQPYERGDPDGSYAMIWRSDDDGDTWAIDYIDAGDAKKRRLTAVLSLDAGLIALGRWYTEPDPTPLRLVWRGGGWTPQEPADFDMVDVGGTEILNGKRALVWPATTSGQPGGVTKLSLDSAGQVVATPVPDFEDEDLALKDSWLLCEGDLLTLSHGTDGPGGMVHVVHRTQDLETYDEILRWSSETQVSTLVAFGDALIFGSDGANLLRAE